ncbi:MAG: KUP/HAK/KT family potassium transporter [Firmicutes bacterium]|nr:KUP/HAK/KT family potassium transporter [Bacillota bacterium]
MQHKRQVKTMKNKFSFGMFLITIGIVYGDIGTSPMYVMKSILEGNGGISQVDPNFVIGALSLVIWTVTLLTTTKYVLIAMKADNHGEGGTFSLFSLVKKYNKYLVFLAMLGGSAILADGILTPAVTITTAVEGLRSIEPINNFLGTGQLKVVLITLMIISALFSIQHSGTSKIGQSFGPVMLLWFSFLGITGITHIVQMPWILKAFNPVYAIQLLFSPANKAGFMILGSVFLATTGAEALYADMGHVGRHNVYFSWPFVKSCLILNYLGQGAWIISNIDNTALHAIHEMNPFYMMLPEMMRPFAVILSAIAAVIASQALITGSFTIVSEAIALHLLPHLEIQYPADTKGQLYIGTVNKILWIGCMLVVLYFRSGARLEAAYGLAITITMLIDTVLIFYFLRYVKGQKLLCWPVLLAFGAIETVFFISSLGKFTHGGYVTMIITMVLFLLMIIWHRGTQLERSFLTRLDLDQHTAKLSALSEDESMPLFSHNLVYLESYREGDFIDRDIVYSILDKDPKRAQAYWFVSVNVLNTPDELYYTVDTYGTDNVFRVQLNLGFKCDQRINIYLRQIVQELQESGELPLQHKQYSIYAPSSVGTFKFCIINKVIPHKSDLGTFDNFVLRCKYTIRRFAGSKIKWYGLDTASVITETVPLFLPAAARVPRIRRA